MLRTFKEWKKAKFFLLLKMACLGLASILSFSHVAQSSSEIPRRSLTLELGEVEGGKGYEVEVTKIVDEKNKKPPVIFKIKGATWSAVLVPGRYDLRVRSIDSRGVPGDWSSAENLVVKLPAVELIKPSSELKIKSSDARVEKVDFEWRPIVGAEKYKLKILKADGSLLQETIEKDPAVSVKMAVAAEYSWEVTAIMAGEIEGEKIASPSRFEIDGPALGEPRILPVDDINTNLITWVPKELSTRFEYSLEMLDEKNGYKKIEEKVLTDPRRLMTKPLSSGDYRISVRALADRRDSSDWVKKEFKTQNLGPKSAAAIDQVRSESAYESKTKFFALASYYVSVLNYSGSNLESGTSGTTTTFSAVGGTGRVGVGTWFKEQSKWGTLLNGDISGFTVLDPASGSQTLTYFSTTLQAIYRLRVGAIGQVRFFAGPQYRELPMTVGTTDGTSYARASVKTLGPVVGVALNHGFYKKIGLQLNAQVGDSLIGVSTPGGGANYPKVSYQLGVLGSLRLSEKILGFAGYAYRLEQASFVAPYADTSRGLSTYNGERFDTLSISGHYFNLMLEYGF